MHLEQAARDEVVERARLGATDKQALTVTLRVVNGGASILMCAATLSSHCHHTVVTLSSHCHRTVITLSSHCHRTIIALSSHCHHTVITLSSHCHRIVITLPSHCHHTVITLSSHCHHTAIALSSHCHHTVITLSSRDLAARVLEDERVREAAPPVWEARELDSINDGEKLLLDGFTTPAS